MKFFRLNKLNIDSQIGRKQTGVYFLGHVKGEDFYIRYIGRSDGRLRERLLDHSDVAKYNFFSYHKTDRLLDAYRIECREWHNAVDLDNEIHPKKPKNLSYKCAYCDKKSGGYYSCQIDK